MYFVRSYGGGCPLAQLAASIGAGDLTFTLVTPLTWFENDGDVLGSDGPFVIAIDRGLPSEEKVLCTSVDNTTGVVGVYDIGGFSGRGYDGTAAVAHNVLGGYSPSGTVQVVASAQEFSDDNYAMAVVMGTTGPTPSNDYVLTWVSGTPEWASTAITPVAVPSGEMYSAVTSDMPSGTWTDVPMYAGGINLSGGMTVSGDNLVVPKAGRYVVAGQAQIAVTTDYVGMQAGLYSSTLGRIIYGNTCVIPAGDSGAPASTFAKTIVCTSGEGLKLQVLQTSGSATAWPLDYVANGVTNWLTVTFVSP